MTILEAIKKKVIKLLGMSENQNGGDTDRLTFINDDERLTKTKLKEYNVWYEGDGDELLNFYTRQNIYEFNFEPFYMRNKKNYFWAISSAEAQIKRTHSGQPRNIVDTLVSIMPFPVIDASALQVKGGDKVGKVLKEIIEDANLERTYRCEQMPLALVEGWGCWKIDWNKDISDYPMPVYYRAKNVDFVVKGGRITGVIYRTYYTNDKKKYVLFETRHLEMKKDAEGKPLHRALIIDKQLFRMAAGNDENIEQVELGEVPELDDKQACIEIAPFNDLLSVPVIFFENTAEVGGYGRSIFTGKIDLFDDLDQALSQSSTSVRLSTPIEYLNSEYLERDRNGMPKKPVSYDRKYVMTTGQKNGEGVSVGDPVQVTQPNLNFAQYSDEAQKILLQIINGIMSPATLGIDIAKKDNAEAQREKEKVTIFTRDTIVAAEIRILKSLCSQLLVAKELMDTGKVTVPKYDISVKFNEFADNSYENKLEKLGQALDAENISEDMYMEKLYGNSLSRADYERELTWLKEHKKAKQDAVNEGMAGMGGDGENADDMIKNSMFPQNADDEALEI